VSTYERWVELSDRDAIGETLSDDDRVFLRDYVTGDSLAAAESDLWESMRSSWPVVDDAEGDRLLADRAVRAVRDAARGGVISSRGRIVRWAAVGLAAAAAFAVFGLRSQKPAEVAMASPQATIEYVASGVRVSGSMVAKGAKVGLGSEIEAVGGAACIALEPTIHACLPAGSTARVVALGGANRRLELIRGRVATALFPLPQGEHFSVVSGVTTSMAVGTAFTVERLADGTSRTVVHEGKVAVSNGADTRVITAHRIGLSVGSAVTEDRVTDHSVTETQDWVALAIVSGRSIESPFETPSVVAPLPSTASVHAAGRATPAAPVARVTEAVRPAVEALPATSGDVAVASESAASYLSMARQSLRDQRWADAASAYRSLVEKFPGSPEAHTVLVPLAKLELDRLSQPAAALAHLDAYAQGGSLAVEAALTRIRAYRSLGREADEARAIDTFLAEHPNSLDAPALRTRRSALVTP
jgi:hypothetical protein